MTPHPDPTRAEQIEAEWREWCRREYGTNPTVHPVHAQSLLTFAAQRSDAMTKLERDVVDDAMSRHEAIFKGDPAALSAANAAIGLSCIALRAARAPVDHLAEARRLLHGLWDATTRDKIDDHLTAAIAARQEQS